MAEQKKPAPDKFQLRPGDIEWVKPPRSLRIREQLRKMSPKQRKGLARKVRDRAAAKGDTTP